jgi:hypothetical protein
MSLLYRNAAVPAAPPLAGKRLRQPSSTPANLEPVEVAAPSQPVVLAPPQRLEGSGTIITSGTTVHGSGTRFLSELHVGDAVEVQHPSSLRAEVRVVKMVLSDLSCGIK